MKHNDSRYVHFSCLGCKKIKIKKKKSQPTDPFFFQTCYSKHNFFLFGGGGGGGGTKRRLLYAYSVVMEFPGQELDCSMPEGREVKGAA